MMNQVNDVDKCFRAVEHETHIHAHPT